MQKLILVFLAVLSFHSFDTQGAQAHDTKSQPTDDHVIIQRRRIVLVRSAELAAPNRQTAVVTYPVVSGLSNPAVLRRVRSAIEFKNIFDYSLKEYREDTWLSEFSYAVNYNRNYLLDLTFKQSGVGAYPDEHTKHFLINLRNGKLIKAADVFIVNKLDGLASLVDAQLQMELQDIARENASSIEDYKEFVESQGEQRFDAKDLDEFSVGAKGITFLYDAGFPHAIKAFEPRGGYLFSYSRFKTFIKRDGPLGQFVN